MNFSEALSNVLRITARPDKTEDAAMGINKAIVYMTLNGDFSRDMIEGSLPINPSLYGDTVDISVLPRFRKFVYLKPTGVRYYLSELAPEKIFTPKNRVQPNVYYVAGQNLTYTLSALSSSLEYGYLTYPPVLDQVTNQTHWLLDAIPYAVVDLAAAYVFHSIGDDASAKHHEKMGMDLYLTLRRDLA